nr:TetR/AcrR family transcriptional regulator [Alkaliphilus hydrothermalis]
MSIKVFAKQGFHKAKIEDIAIEANIGKGTVYQYFTSKKELFKEMVAYCMMGYNSQLEAIIVSQLGIKDKLVALVDFYDVYIREHFDIAQMILSQTELLSKEMKDWIMREKVKTHLLIEKMIDIGIEKKEVRPDIEREVAALAIIGTLNQYLGKKVLIQGHKGPKIDSAPLVSFLLKAIQ